jgi:hypothetical protein
MLILFFSDSPADEKRVNIVGENWIEVKTENSDIITNLKEKPR